MMGGRIGFNPNTGHGGRQDINYHDPYNNQMSSMVASPSTFGDHTYHLYQTAKNIFNVQLYHGYDKVTVRSNNNTFIEFQPTHFVVKDQIMKKELRGKLENDLYKFRVSDSQNIPVVSAAYPIVLANNVVSFFLLIMSLSYSSGSSPTSYASPSLSCSPPLVPASETSLPTPMVNIHPMLTHAKHGALSLVYEVKYDLLQLGVSLLQS
ncbi:hypothetical protein CK203_085493 [Vitis vinifera]|uniref:Uncharacterized protein n=1 Tax=Vitis vinifera TaxID=29760 RepID=A0A438C2J5_VITVI|nr:hypothetical protein CK203_085493 [Vitis vinifera]